MGAWIEMRPSLSLSMKTKSHSIWVRGLKSRLHKIQVNSLLVALYMGAWIEILTELVAEDGTYVALYMGAWIEMRTR